ncbi:MAG: YraN family protein [Candidatus Cloacimonadota bacterium]|nr:YraN family protein [Candidatus Cloacimonadota bacterium]
MFKLIMDRKEFGKFGEDIATKFLEHNGYRIIERNYHSIYGEIDIICKKNNQLIFIEVKARKSLKFGEPLEAVTEKKREKIIKTAYHFITKHQLDLSIRFDIITIQYISKEKRYKFEHIKNAFLGTPI